MARQTKKDKEFVQYSKKICKWSLLGVFVLVMIAMALAVFVCDNGEQIEATIKLTQYFTTLAGVVVTGYFGRASLEDFAGKKDTLNNLLNDEEEVGYEKESVG